MRLSQKEGFDVRKKLIVISILFILSCLVVILKCPIYSFEFENYYDIEKIIITETFKNNRAIYETKSEYDATFFRDFIERMVNEQKNICKISFSPCVLNEPSEIQYTIALFTKDNKRINLNIRGILNDNCQVDFSDQNIIITRQDDSIMKLITKKIDNNLSDELNDKIHLCKVDMDNSRVVESNYKLSDFRFVKKGTKYEDIFLKFGPENYFSGSLFQTRGYILNDGNIINFLYEDGMVEDIFVRQKDEEAD